MIQYTKLGAYLIVVLAHYFKLRIYDMKKFYIFPYVVRRLTRGNMKQHKKVQLSHRSDWQITISNIQFDSRNWVFFKICCPWRDARARTCIEIKLELISAGRKASDQVKNPWCKDSTSTRPHINMLTSFSKLIQEIKGAFVWDQSGIRIIGIMRVRICLGAIRIPEYLDFHSGYSAPRSRTAGIYSGIYSYCGISQTNAP